MNELSKLIVLKKIFLFIYYCLKIDERSQTPSKLMSHKTHSLTPNLPLSSPGAASVSSFHEELDNSKSPGLPKTPASPSLNESSHSKSKSANSKVKLI